MDLHNSKPSHQVAHSEKQHKWPKCAKTYNSKWESDPLLKTWINRHPKDIGKVVCRFCTSVIRAHKNDLLEHTRTLKHQRNFMQNSSPDEYNQFVVDLNEIRKDPSSAKRRSTSTVHNVQPSASPTQQNNNNIIHLKYEPNTVSLLTDGMHGNTIGCVSGALSSTAFLSLGAESTSATSSATFTDVLGGGGEDLWSGDREEFSMSAADVESPSELVSVVLEEQQSPSSTTTINSAGSAQCGIVTGADSSNAVTSIQTLNNMVLTGISGLGNMNFTLVNANGTPITSPQIVSATSSDIISNGANLPVLSVTTEESSVESVTSSILLDSKPNILQSFTIKDITTAIEEGFFSMPDLFALVKAAVSQIENSVSGKICLKQATDLGSGLSMAQTIPVSISIASSDRMITGDESAILTSNKREDDICH